MHITLAAALALGSLYPGPTAEAYVTPAAGGLSDSLASREPAVATHRLRGRVLLGRTVAVGLGHTAQQRLEPTVASTTPRKLARASKTVHVEPDRATSQLPTDLRVSYALTLSDDRAFVYDRRSGHALWLSEVPGAWEYGEAFAKTPGLTWLANTGYALGFDARGRCELRRCTLDTATYDVAMAEVLLVSTRGVAANTQIVALSEGGDRDEVYALTRFRDPLTGRPEYELWSLNVTTGEVAWRYTGSDLSVGPLGSEVLRYADGRLYFVGVERALALDVSGEPVAVWERVFSRGSSTTCAAVAPRAGLLFASSLSEGLRAYRLDDGNLAWGLPDVKPWVGDLAVASDGLVALCSQRRALVRIGLPAGNQVTLLGAADGTQLATGSLTQTADGLHVHDGSSVFSIELP